MFQIDPILGLLAPARQLDSPHCDDRPPGTSLSLIVVHCISLPAGEFGGPFIDALFTGTLGPTDHPQLGDVAALRVSAHLLVRRDGEVNQYVPFHRRAWHAGVSEYRGRPRCNDFSVGIECEGTPFVAYEPAQYDALSAIVSRLLAAYPSLSPEHIVGHSDIAPGRRRDPGPRFDWERLRAGLQGMAKPAG